MILVDTHLHLWDLQQFPYSWCRSIPALNRSYRWEDYKGASQGLGIHKSVFMECDVDTPYAPAEAAALQTLALQEPAIAGLVASARPEDPDFAARVEALLPLSKLRGIRRVLHTQPDALSTSPLFRANVRCLSAWGLTFDLCVRATQLPQAEALVAACPDVTFILDHCGVPDLAPASFADWASHLKRLAAHPNVVCKVSGVVAYAPPASTEVATLRPWFDHVIACFGWQRVLWGSDWPVCTLGCSLAHWTALTRQLLASASPDQVAAFTHLNAERIYRV